MRYKIFCSDEYEYTNFYCDNENDANLLFNIAVASKYFEYVTIEEMTEKGKLVREWSESDA